MYRLGEGICLDAVQITFFFLNRNRLYAFAAFRSFRACAVGMTACSETQTVSYLLCEINNLHVYKQSHLDKTP